MEQPGLSPLGIDIYCPDCGYNLRAATGERCAECGRSIADLRDPVSRIPWTRRREIGRVAAYWKTVWMVHFRQKEFCNEMARPVSFSDAQRFRWTTVALAFLPIVIGGVLMWGLRVPSPSDNEILRFFWTNPWLITLLHFCVLLFLAAATGLPSYFFHPRELDVGLQNRAIALSYYASGPLSLLFLPAAAVLLAFLWEDTDVGICCVLLAVILPIVLFGIWWSELHRLARRLMPQQRQRALWIGFCLPLLWLGVFGLIFLFVPAVVLYVALIIDSLR